MTAIGVLHALYRTTHKVPEDISVVGFDDIHLAQFMLPPLTTVQMSCKHLAAAAVEALRAGIESDHPKAAQTEWHIPTQLVVRQSSAFPRGTLPALVERNAASAKAQRRSGTSNCCELFRLVGADKVPARLLLRHDVFTAKMGKTPRPVPLRAAGGRAQSSRADWHGSDSTPRCSSGALRR